VHSANHRQGEDDQHEEGEQTTGEEAQAAGGGPPRLQPDAEESLNEADS
jgi:hypothetical protein